MTGEARHTLTLTDRQVTLLERALLAYAQLIRIQTAAATKTEMDESASVTATIQQHLHCGCPMPHTTPKTPVPIEKRRVI
jgi:hypothetical protein